MIDGNNETRHTRTYPTDAISQEHIFFLKRLNVPVNNFSVMSGRSQRFLGFTSAVGSKCVLLEDTTRCRLWGSTLDYSPLKIVVNDWRWTKGMMPMSIVSVHGRNDLNQHSIGFNEVSE